MSAADLLLRVELAPPLATLAAAAGAYALGVRRTARWPAARSAAFAAGLVCLALALASGIDAWADRRFAVHMLQHLLILLVAPPLLAAGAPVSLALRALHGPARRRLAAALHARGARALAHPATGLAAFTAVMLGSHMTGVYTAALRHGLLHDAEHVAYLAAGLAYWAPLVGADPLPGRPRAAGRFVWLLASMPPMGLLAAWLTSGPLRYPGYASASEQVLAANVMWIGGTLLVAAALVWLTWDALLHEERVQRRREALAARPARPAGGGGA